MADTEEKKTTETATAPTPTPQQPTENPPAADTTAQNTTDQSGTTTNQTTTEISEDDQTWAKVQEAFTQLKDWFNGAGKDDNTFVEMMDRQMSGIFGLPYQFSSIVDGPISKTTNGYTTNSNIGKKFSEKILSIAPVVFFTPGEPEFMKGYGSKAKEAAKNLLLSTWAEFTNYPKTDDPAGNRFDDGRFYSFTDNFPQYKLYANTALQTLAMYMNIEDVEVPVPGKEGEMVKLKSIDMEDFLNQDFQKMFGTNKLLPFYVDAITEISDSFSNSTGESMFAQSVNQYSQTAREMQFLMGSGDQSGKLIKALRSGLETVIAEGGQMVGEAAELFGGNSMISKITGSLGTVLTGGKIVFPEIWTDSSYSRSYNIEIKLRSPDPDPVSIFLNIYMPMILLISLAAPRQLGYSSNSHTSPFLVRATYKSFFNCDLGIIDSLTINKGGENCWNVLGQPTSANVSISLKDLYGSLAISKQFAILSNTAQLDYLANLASVEFEEGEAARAGKLTWFMLQNAPAQIFDNIWGTAKLRLNHAANSLLSMIGFDRRAY